MDTPVPQEPAQSLEYQAAYACFQAAATLERDGRLVNGPRIRAIVGRGSHSTTKKYADLWKALEAGGSPDLSPDVEAAYEAVKAGSEDPAVFTPPPPEELKDLLNQLWEMTQEWIAAGCRETEEMCGDELAEMEDKVTVANAARDKAKAELAKHEAERVKLATQNTELQQLISKLTGQLEALEAQLHALTDKNATLEQTINDQSNQIVRLTMEVQIAEERLTESKRREGEAQEKVVATQGQLENLRQAKEQLQERLARMEEAEKSLTSQLERERTRVEALDGKVYEQTGTIAALTGEAKAAEERVKASEETVSLLRKELQHTGKRSLPYIK
jgi:predicted  nucleic acid-binding Zn-ribbon protein